MAEGARIAEAAGADIIDINMGCPARHVTGGQSGSALMRDLDHALKLIEATIAAVKVPVTLKMRLGWDDRSLNAPELARRAEAAGVQMITVHGRTRCQFYKGEADWAAVRAVRDAVSRSARRQRRHHLVREGGQRARNVGRRCRHDRARRAGPALAARSDRPPPRNRTVPRPRRRWPSSSAISARSMMKSAAITACASGSATRASISAGRWRSQPSAAARRRETLKSWRQKILTSEDPHRVHRSLAGCIRRFCMECCRMTSAAEHRRPVPSDSEAILNALPNPVLLVAPDGTHRRRQHRRRILLRDFDAVSAAAVAEGTGAVRQSAAGADRSGAHRAARRSTNTRSISARRGSAAIARSIFTSPRSPSGPAISS